MRVLLALLVTCFPALARADDDDGGAWEHRVADPLAVEATLYGLGIDVEQADLLTTDAGRRPPSLRCGPLLGPADPDPRSGRDCAALVSRWENARTRAFLATRPGGQRAPCVVLVPDDREFGSLVVLVPGDSVTVREVVRAGRVVRTSMRVRHADGALELRRRGERGTVCVQGGDTGPRCTRVDLTARRPYVAQVGGPDVP